MRIRRTSYLKDGKPITLPFVSCVADQHPEAFHAGAGATNGSCAKAR